MSEKFLLFLTDDEIILYKGLRKHTYHFIKGIEYIQTELKKIISSTPKVPLYILIDRNQQDTREEQLPPLLLWDRQRLLFHKRESWKSQGGYHGYRFLKQDRKSFLQWVSLTQHDALFPWLLWISSLSNPLWGVSFVSLEAEKFLKKYYPSSHDYHMLIYKVSSDKTRHVIFKDRRLLLFRPLSDDEDLRTSLHFLSRTCPDIHEKLQVLSLINNKNLTLPNIKTLSDPQEFLDFLVSQRKPSLSLNINTGSRSLWIKRGWVFFLTILLCLEGVMLYQILNYKKEAGALIPKINALNIKINYHEDILKSKNIVFIKSAINHYNYIKHQIKDLFKTLENLFSVLEKHGIRLQSLQWTSEKGVSVEIGFFMQNHKGDLLSDEFNALLSSFESAFPHCQIDVLEGPFKSSSHETYRHPSAEPYPMVHLRMILP